MSKIIRRVVVTYSDGSWVRVDHAGTRSGIRETHKPNDYGDHTRELGSFVEHEISWTTPTEESHGPQELPEAGAAEHHPS